MATWTPDGKPSWLKENDVESSNTSRKSTNWQTVSPDEDSGSKRSISNGGSKRTVNTSQSDETSTDEVNRGNEKGGCCSKFITFICFIFFVLFITGAYFFDNDKSFLDWQWMIFYCYQATIAGLTLLSRLCCRGTCQSFISSIAVGGMIWAIVLVIVTSLRYKNKTVETTASEGPTFHGFYDDLTTKDQSAFELASASTGMLCCVFHIMLGCCK